MAELRQIESTSSQVATDLDVSSDKNPTDFYLNDNFSSF